MTKTQIYGRQVADGSIQKVDLDVVTSGAAVITKVVAGSNISLNSTGVDSGTGDVTINVTGLSSVATGGNLTDLTDVSISSPTSEQILKYNGSEWINAAAPITGATILDGLNDVTITSAANNQYLKFDGSAWVNSALPEASATISGVVNTGTQTLKGNKTLDASVWTMFPASGATSYISFAANYYPLIVGKNNGACVIDATGYGNQLALRTNSGTSLAIQGGPNDHAGGRVAIGQIAYDGALTVQSINTGTRAADPTLVLKALSSQTGALLDARSSAGASLFTVDSSGSLSAGTVPVARVTGLATVATSGSYTDLSNKPTIPSITGLATETYVDNKVAAVVNSAPAVLDTLKELADALNQDPNFATTVAGQIGNVASDVAGLDTRVTTAESDILSLQTAVTSKVDTSSLAAVATSGSYNDLLNKPTLFSGSYTDLTDKPTLFSGSYTDLTNKPTIPSALDDLSDVTVSSPSNGQVLQFNGTAWVNGAAPSTFSGSYNDLTDKPTFASFTTLTSPSNNQFLKYNGTAWVNSDLPVANGTTVGIVSAGDQVFLGRKQLWGGSEIKAPALNQVALFVKGVASQSANLVEFQNSSGTVLSSINSTGGLTTNGVTVKGGSIFDTSSYPSPYAVTGTGAISGTNYSFSFYGSTNTGSLLAVSSSPYPAIAAANGGNICFASSGYGTSISPNSFETWAVALSVNNNHANPASIAKFYSNSVLKYDFAKDGSFTASGTGTFNAPAAASKALVVKGAASQTANLFEAQDSSGTVLFSIDKDGSVASGTVPVARVTGLATVGTTGSYTDLINKPTIPSLTGYATETYVDNKVAALVNSAPAALDTLNELATALGNDANFSNTITNALAGKASTTTVSAVENRVTALENNAFVTREVPTGSIDGSNKVFVLANTPVSDSEQVFVNGTLQEPGAANDYTISANTISFNDAPLVGWKIHVSYATGSYMVAPGGLGASSSETRQESATFTWPGILNNTSGTPVSYTFTHNKGKVADRIEILVLSSTGGWIPAYSTYFWNQWWYGCQVGSSSTTEVTARFFGRDATADPSTVKIRCTWFS